MADRLREAADLGGLPESGMVIVAFSGGADSMALTHFLMGQISQERILCAHVNHMLRGEEAEADVLFAESFCKSHGLRFRLLREDVAALAEKEKIGTEESGRLVRYRFFDSLRTGENDVIVTAHNANDNVETVLMNLARGTGLSGLCGIPPGRGAILRPLLRVSREEIERYCRENSLPYVTDSSNLQDAYTRNRIRRHVLPELIALNPRLTDAVARLTDAVREAQDYLVSSAEALLREARVPYGLSLEVLNKAHPAVRKQALKLWLESQGCGRLSAEHISKAAGNLTNGNRLTLPGNLGIECSAGVLTCRRAAPKDWEVPAKIGETRLPNGKVLKILEKTGADTQNARKINKLLFNSQLDCDTITDALTARGRHAGDRFAPAGRGVTKTLKNLFGEMKIPAANRDDQVILQSGGEIVYVEGAGVSEKAKVTADTKRILQIVLETEEPRECEND